MEAIAAISTHAQLPALLNDCIIDAVIAINNNNEIIAWNKAAEQFSGIGKEAAIGKQILTVIPTLANDSETIAAIENAKLGFKSFISANNNHFHRKHTENQFIPIKTNEDNIVGVMHIIHDVSHRIKAEMELQTLHRQLENRYQQLQKTSSELANFTYISSSNIKEPIKNIYTTVEHLIKTEGKALSDSGKASFRRIQSSLNRMNLLLDDMLSLSGIDILHKPEQTVDVNNVIHTALEKLGRKVSESGAQITVGNLCSVIGHPSLLELLFVQLIDNAIKFNNQQPRVEIECEKIGQKGTGHNIAPAYWHVMVRDNGIGFEQSETGRIFNMFEKLHTKAVYRGSGIGLTLAAKIMDAHNGYIEAESEPDKGSTFHCYFPLEQGWQ